MIKIALGNTGITVEKNGFGCLPIQRISRTEAAYLLRKAVDGGINYFDTANVYSAGTSEEFVGRALKDLAHRNEIVVATKAYFPMGEGRNCRGLFRKELMYEVD